MHVSTTIGTAVVAGALIVATTAPALAVPGPVVDLRGDGIGAFVTTPDGAAQLTGTLTGKPFKRGSYTATLAAADGSLPEPGSCEPATATLTYTATRGRHLNLAAAGDVCGTWPDATYVVTHSFTGSYDVTRSSLRKVRRTDGWIGIVLATEGRANVEVFDS